MRFLALLLLLVAGPALAAPPVKTPQQKLFDDLYTWVDHNPEIRAALSGKSDSEVRLEAAALTARGLPRLDDATLRRRAQIMAVLLSQMSDLNCARLAKGNVSVPVLMEVQSAVLAQDSATVAFWLDASKRAILAELHHTPAPIVAQEEIN